MKPTLDAVMRGVDLMGELMLFFPKSLAARSVIATEIHSFAGTEQQLAWFIDATVSHFSKFEGLPFLRALYCTKFEPADGMMPVVELPGYSTEAMEAKFRAKEMDENERRLEDYKQKAISEGKKPGKFLLPEVKRIQ